MIYPDKLKKGDEVRVVTPSRSLKLPWISDELIELAEKRLTEDLGLKVTYGKHVNVIDSFGSSSVEQRVEDLHDAFKDPNVKMVLSVIGGFNSNQLIDHLDYDLIKENPKILCGYSDTTAVTTAITAKTGLVTYSGNAFFSFGEKKGFEYSMDYFKQCMFSDDPIEIEPSREWSDELWANHQDDRHFRPNEGYWVLNEGEASGAIYGANLCTFNLVQGTEFMPDLSDSVLFLEDDFEANPAHFDRDLLSLIHQPGFEGVRGIVIGRFQTESVMSRELLEQIISTKPALKDMPILANTDFGHTNPKFTFPIGGEASFVSKEGDSSITITKH